jgi:RNA polymerase sigma-70 factor (ECF subfamily)
MFEEFYDKWFSRIYNYSRYRTLSVQDADELTALIFEKLFSKFNSFDSSRGNIEVWTFTLARNVVNDFYRRKKIRSFFSLSDSEETIAAPENSTGTLEKEEDKRLILNALSRIDERSREIISLKYWQNLNNRQIAQITAVSETNVGTILARAVKKLKDILNAEESL